MANFTEEQIEAVWANANGIEGENQDYIRQDHAGAWIKKEQYGIESLYGWEIDHKFPESLGGGEELVNLQVLHWKNNRSKSNNFPVYQTEVTFNIIWNIQKASKREFTKEAIWEFKRLYPNNCFLDKL
jgi:5-methylcytosine-specific restriction endonuclease McrA